MMCLCCSLHAFSVLRTAQAAEQSRSKVVKVVVAKPHKVRLRSEQQEGTWGFFLEDLDGEDGAKGLACRE